MAFPLPVCPAFVAPGLSTLQHRSGSKSVKDLYFLPLLVLDFGIFPARTILWSERPSPSPPRPRCPFNLSVSLPLLLFLPPPFYFKSFLTTSQPFPRPRRRGFKSAWEESNRAPPAKIRIAQLLFPFPFGCFSLLLGDRSCCR